MLNDRTPADSEVTTPKASLTTSTNAQASGTAPGASDISRLIWRALRGRYQLTILLALVAAGAGAAAGWVWAGPLYLSDGMVRIASALPAVIQQTDQNQPIPMFESFMQAQQELVTSRFVLDKVVQDPAWESGGLRNHRPTIEALAGGLKVEVRPKSENLRITYTDPDPSVASSVVGSTIAAYQKVFEQDDQKLEQHRLQLLKDYRNTLVSQLDLGKGAAAPTTLPSTATASAAPAPVQQQQQPVPPLAERLAMSDLAFRRLLQDRDYAKDQLDQAAIDYGPNYPYMSHLTLTYQRASQRVEQYMDDYLASHQDTENGPAVAQSSPAAPAAPTVALAPAPLSASMQLLQNDLDDVSRRIAVLQTESAMPKRFEIVSLGNLPVPMPNRQIKWTATGGGLGGSLVLGTMILIGSYRRRYTVCADVSDSLASKVRFVVAVPELESASKSRRWIDAAQCVHCLRQKLEQNAKAYMVTSADWKEGRTSLSMSLALSLSGAGARTILVDADLATRGLTRSLGLDDHAGFFEMLHESDETPLAPIHANGIAVLPAGAANEADGMSIAAPAVARLLSRLKASFDVVIIDAGPALGRVETSILARQVDGVLLAFGRGQQQSLVAKALDELDSAGVKVLGAVFNRAEPRDFDRSVQRRAATQSIWQPRPIAQPLTNFGPLVQAVATSLRHEVELLPVGGDARPRGMVMPEAAGKLHDRDILCFSHDWTGATLSKNHLMRLLSQRNRILWVNSIGYRRPTASGYDIRRMLGKLWAFAKPVTEVEPNLFVLNPLAIPAYGGAMSDFNRRWLGRQIKRAMANLGFTRPINFVFNPAAAIVAGNLGEEKLVYYCVDEFSAFSGVNAAGLARLEKQLMSKADLVVTSSEPLFESKSPSNPNTILVRHGVDYDHFRKALDPATIIPPEIAHLPRPVIGYFGLIAKDWVDIELLIHLAKAMPEASLVMLGKVTMDVSALKRLPNVHILGPKPYETLPNFCKGFDAGIIPFPINRATLNANPLKLREYLAAGVQVVSTAIPESQAVSQCRIASSPESFVAEVQAALNHPGSPAARSLTMAGESWAARLAEVERAMLVGRRQWNAVTPQAA
jgi:Mrp family chromosome partitioning ATPase/glycosyltransferase involved in cell wall biosynthesis